MIRILISQQAPATAKSPYYDLRDKYGVEIVFQPLIAVERVSTREFRDQRINVADYTAIVFTSRQAIDHFFAICKEIRYTTPDDLKYFAKNEAISLYIQKYVQYRKRKVFFSKNGTMEELYTLMAKHKGERYLVPQSTVSSTDVADAMTKHKLNFSTSVMYRTVTTQLPKDVSFDYDLVVAFTPTGVKGLLENVPEIGKMKKVKLGAFGAGTAKAYEEYGLKPALVAPTPECPSITEALDQYVAKLVKVAKAAKTKAAKAKVAKD